MERDKCRSRFDVEGLELFGHRVPGRSVPFEIDLYRVQPVDILRPAQIGRWGHAGDRGECPGVVRGDPSLGIENPVNPPQLRHANGGLEICHPIIETNDFVPVSPRRHPMVSELTHHQGEVLPVRHNHSALTGGDNLVAKETEGADITDTAHDAAVDGRPVSLRSVLDDGQSVTRAAISRIGLICAGWPYKWTTRWLWSAARWRPRPVPDPDSTSPIRCRQTPSRSGRGDDVREAINVGVGTMTSSPVPIPSAATAR